MLKKHFFIVMFMIIVLASAGCATNLGVYDPSVPQERLCTLEIDGELFVRQFNNDNVRWNFSFPQSGVVVQIPAGHHTFLIDYVVRGQLYSCAAYDIGYSHTFDAGKNYVMKPVQANGQVRIEVTVK